MRSALRPAALLLALFATASAAADRPVAGDHLLLTDPANAARRRVQFVAARDLAIDPAKTADPRVGGATLEILGEGQGDGATGVLPLDASLWTGIGRPPGKRGYRYADRRPGAAVRKVQLTVGPHGGTLAVTGGGGAWPYRIIQPQGPIFLRLTLGDDVYCAEFTAFARDVVGKVSAAKALPPPSCTPVVATCGNGVVEGAEGCDDGNTLDGDGCSASCRLETTAAICAGVPSVTGTAITSVRVASGLVDPVHVTAPPLDPSRVFVVEQGGTIRVIKNSVLQPKPFLDLRHTVESGDERGLLSLAFHPDYAHNGRFFVFYTAPGGDLTIARYQLSPVPDLADPTSGRVLLTIPHHIYGNHNGGQLAFGPDGFLYASTGDGGGAGDPLASGQSLGTLLGKQLRIDVDVASAPYRAVPPGNPFPDAGDPFDLIWAYGLRNPWRFSFDRGTGDLYIGDVGQDTIEEVDVQPAGSAGANYGWHVFEGGSCFDPDPQAQCPSPPDGYTMPVLQYDHGDGCSVIGGFVYRGCALPDLRGTYLYSDYCSGFFRTFDGVAGGAAQNAADRTTDVRPSGGLTIDSVTSFGEDARGEIYVVDQDGEIYEIVPAPAP
ncbi:MAG TPA: PQQ-dependent sugar dehydrogenase [Candidatus Binatia bacterium]|jgi:hypothetical protein